MRERASFSAAKVRNICKRRKKCGENVVKSLNFSKK